MSLATAAAALPQDCAANDAPLSAARAPGVPLAHLAKGERAIVQALAEAPDAAMAALRLRLIELGFAAGEEVRVVAESFPGRDPMAIRVGNTTFALRRREAALVLVERVAQSEHA